MSTVISRMGRNATYYSTRRKKRIVHLGLVEATVILIYSGPR